MKLDHFLQPHAPWLDLLVATSSEAYDAAMATHGVAHILRGQKMRTADELFDEFAAALQFPPYFGENWDALDECLADLEWLNAQAYVLVILDANHLLERDSAESRQTFRGLLERAAKEWAKPSPGPTPRPGRIFRVILQATADQEGHVRTAWSVPKSK